MIPDFSSLKILVAGDAMLDENLFGDIERISPEAPVPVVLTHTKEQRPGGAANVAMGIVALGAQARLCAVVGDDARAEILAEILSNAGVECNFIKAANTPTVHKVRVLSRNQQLIRLDSEQALVGYEDAFEVSFARSLDNVDAVVLSDYGKGTLNRVEPLVALARARSIPVLVDPKGVDFHRYRGASMLTPNQSEFEAVVGAWSDEIGFLAAGEALRAQLDLDALLVTRGEKGMVLFSSDEQTLALPAETREVFDVTGAGDTVISLMSAGLGSGWSGEDSAALANLGAGIVVRKIGAATVSPSELDRALNRRGAGGCGLVSVDELELLVGEARQRGERIVMTNGCFDILHAGHVSYLGEAKRLGDRLIVAVNDDASVAGIKGPSRPITPLEDRIAVLSGLAAVDWVVPFSEETPAGLIERFLPDILVKGGDYAVDEIAGGKAVIARGGEVRVLALKEGRSTSALIESIKSC